MFPAHPHLHHAFSFSVPITPENFSLHFLPSYLLSTPFSQPLFHNEVFILLWLSLHCSCCPGGVLRVRDSVVGRGSNSSREHQDFRITWCNHLRFSMPTDPTVVPPLPPTPSSSTLNSHDLNELGTDSPGHPAKALVLGDSHFRKPGVRSQSTGVSQRG